MAVFFFLHVSLQLKINFAELNLASEIFPRCHPSAVAVFNAGATGRRILFQMCGRRSNHSLYISFRKVAFSVRFISSPTFALKTVFDTRSPGQIMTTEAKGGDIGNFQAFQDSLFIVDTEVFRMHFVLDTLKTLSLTLLSTATETQHVAVFFDGPGFRSTPYVISQFPMVLQSSGHQCVLLATGTSTQIKFKEHFITPQKWVQIPNTVSHRDSQEIGVGTQMIVLDPGLRKNGSTSINISFSGFQHTGPSDETCSGEGLWFYDSNELYLPSFEKISYFCPNTPAELVNLPNLYSSKNFVLALVSSFRGYSSTEFNFTISLTTCHTHTWDLCGYALLSSTRHTICSNDEEEKAKMFDNLDLAHIFVDANEDQCVVFQFLSKGLSREQRKKFGTPHLYAVVDDVCEGLVSFHKETSQVEHVYRVTGYLSNLHLKSPVVQYAWPSVCPIYSVNQLFIVGGENILKRKSSITIEEYEDQGTHSLHPTAHCVLDINKSDVRRAQFKKITSLNPVYFINPTNRNALRFQMTLHSQVPTGDKGLMFEFRSLTAFSWLEIVSGPLGSPKAARVNEHGYDPVAFLSFDSSFHHLKQIFLNKIMQLEVDCSTRESGETEGNVTLRMRTQVSVAF